MDVGTGEASKEQLSLSEAKGIRMSEARQRPVVTDVLHVPGYSGGNPYQRLLVDALASRGVNVGLQGPQGRLALLGTLANGRPRLIHLHWVQAFLLSHSAPKTIVRSLIFIAELLALKLSGTRIVWTVHNLVNHEGLHASIEASFDRIIARLCDRLIVHYPDAADAVRCHFRLPSHAKVEVVPHGHYIGHYSNTIAPAAARHQLGLDTKDTIFLLFGGVRTYKEIPHLIRSFQQLNSNRVQLLIAGKPGTQEIERQIRAQCAADSRIHMRLEFIPDDAIQIYMNSADVVVVPSSQIFTSGSAILAMSFGKALIAANTPHLRYLIADGGGILYESGDDDGLHAALDAALQLNLWEMGARNFKFIGQFSWPKVATMTHDIYEQLMRSTS